MCEIVFWLQGPDVQRMWIILGHFTKKFIVLNIILLDRLARNSVMHRFTF